MSKSLARQWTDIRTHMQICSMTAHVLYLELLHGHEFIYMGNIR